MGAVLTLTDGKPSFLFNTYEKVLQLKDKHVNLFFSPVTEFAGEARAHEEVGELALRDEPRARPRAHAAEG